MSVRSEISVSKVAGGALASVAAAYLGSYLGVQGTFWGAGLTSVVITVGGTVSQSWLEQTRHKANAAAAKAVQVRPLKRGEAGGYSSDPAGPSEHGEQETRRFGPVGQGGWCWPGGESVVDDPDGEPPTQVLPAARQLAPQQPRHSSGRRWLVAGVSGVLMFGLCLLVVTSWEGVTGGTLAGGQGGTTIGHVVTSAARPHASPQAPAPTPASGPPSAGPPAVSSSASVPPSPEPSGQPEQATSSATSEPPEPSSSNAPTDTDSSDRVRPTTPGPTSTAPETGTRGPQSEDTP